ncbi:MAG: helix-turn-helix domain-containing protein [Pseudomonadota bacterium]
MTPIEELERHPWPELKKQFNAHRERLARLGGRSVEAPKKVEPVKPAALRVEIVDDEPEDTQIPVISCTGQIVIVTGKQIIEARMMFERASGEGVTITKIQGAVCRHFGISRVDLVSQRRAQSITRPRQIGIYLAKKLTPYGYPTIGARFGGRDHSTAISAVRRIEKLMKTDEAIAASVNALLEELGGHEAHTDRHSPEPDSHPAQAFEDRPLARVDSKRAEAIDPPARIGSGAQTDPQPADQG